MGKITENCVETVGPGKYEDGHGLRLVVSPSGARKWVFRYMIKGIRHELGLGPTHAINLSTARLKAQKMREQIYNGVDPIKAKTSSEFL